MHVLFLTQSKPTCCDTHTNYISHLRKSWETVRSGTPQSGSLFYHASRHPSSSTVLLRRPKIYNSPCFAMPIRHPKFILGRRSKSTHGVGIGTNRHHSPRECPRPSTERQEHFHGSGVTKQLGLLLAPFRLSWYRHASENTSKTHHCCN